MKKKKLSKKIKLDFTYKDIADDVNAIKKSQSKICNISIKKSKKKKYRKK